MFDIPEGASVVTSSRITTGASPILFVAHQRDEKGVIWQFLDGHDFVMAEMQLVRLDTILKLDPGIVSVSNTPVGSISRRESPTAPWVISEDPEGKQ